MAHGREGAGADCLQKEQIVAFFSEWLGLNAESVGEEVRISEGVPHPRKEPSCSMLPFPNLRSSQLRVLEIDCYEQARPEVTFPNVPLKPLRERGCVVCSGGKNMLVVAGDWAAGQGVVSSAISSGIRAAETLSEGLGWATTKMEKL